jgi:hypothetical protein
MHRYKTPKKQRNRPTFASPVVVLRLSPILALPSTVLAGICQFLEPSSVCRFEATCRALSVSIITARAALDHSATIQQRENEESKKERESSDDLPPGKSVEANESSKDEVVDESETSAKHSSRASKRLQSQIITSGKRAELSHGLSRRDTGCIHCFIGAGAVHRGYIKDGWRL